MKYLKIMGLCLVAMFAVSAAIAASASAVTVWESRHCEKNAAGKFNNSICSTEGAGEKFEWSAWAELKVATEVRSKGTLRLANHFAKVALECSGTNKGTVGPGSKDETTEIKATECKRVEGTNLTCPEPSNAVAVNTPWVTEVVLVEEEGVKKVRDIVKAKNGGEFGWKVECNKKVSDECLVTESTTGIKNNEALGSVESTFDAKTPDAKCKLHGPEEGEKPGLVTGTVFIEALSGSQIRVSL